MTAEEREATLARLAEFVSQQRGADDLADRGSLDRAADLVALYEERDENGRRRWATELPPLKTRRHAGRPVDPESFSRFTKWLQEEREIQLAGSFAYRLRDAHQLRTNYFASGEIIPTGEAALRPLKWLTKNGHDKAVASVWRDACDRAGGPPTQRDVRAALAAWKRDHVPQQKRPPSAAASGPTGPAAVRLELERLARQLMEQDPEQFLLGFDHIEAMASKRFSKSQAVA